MTPVRTFVSAALVAGCCTLAACGSPTSGAAHQPTASPASAALVVASETPNTTAATSTRSAPSLAEASVTQTPVARAAGSGGSATQLPTIAPASASPAAVAPVDAVAPQRVVADAGERGRRYLAALRAAGLPPTGMDAAEILYAQGTCKAVAEGMSRPDILRQFASVGRAYAEFTPLRADQVAEIYVRTAERFYC